MIIALVAAVGLWTVHCMGCLAVNVRRARTIGIPYLVIPVSPLNPIWIVFEPLIYFVIDHLPFSLGAVNYYGRRGWHWRDKAQSHVRMGDAWCLVTPADVFVQLCDPAAINDIFARRPEFARPTHLFRLLAVFGPNVSTVEWADWQRQRKIVSAPFNENTNTYVWSESLTQAQDMIKSWTSYGSSGVVGLGHDSRTLALNVLAATGFRQSYQFQSSMEPAKNEARTYRESLATVMDNSLLIMLFPPRLLRLPFTPHWCRHIGEAVDDFKSYMMNMLHTEQDLLSQGKPGTGNLMSSLVRASEASNNSNGRNALTVSEILGNIYVINFAGHDTTANSLAYCILLFAAYPEVQEWVAEEIREVLRDDDRSNWDYKEMFPKLKRCYAVLLETIRLFPPVMALPKSVVNPTAQLYLGESDRTIQLPQGAIVCPNVLAAHTHPKYWPDETLVWRPQRWITGPSSSTSLARRLERETVHEAPSGTYLPWSAGPQSCPGRKFSQVEFVATISSLFREHRVQVLQNPGEDFEKARDRILAVTQDSLLTLLLRMRDSDSTRLVWTKVKAR